jgi:lysophospholipase L1-like esterase
MKSVHVIGDSISIHYGPFLKKYIQNRFTYSRKEGNEGNLDSPEGANGGDSSMVLEYLKECKRQNLYWDLVVINCGLHDIKKTDGVYQINIDNYQQNLQSIFNILKELSKKTVWVNTTPVDDEIHNSRKKEFQRYNVDVVRYNYVAEKIAELNNVYIIDLYSFCKSLGDSEIYQDHVHFKTEFRKLQAAFIAGQLLSEIG